MDVAQSIQHMVDILLKDQGLQYTADEAAKLLNKPLWLFDLNYRFLTTPDAVFSVPELIADSFRHGTMPPEGIQYIYTEKIPDKLWADNAPVHYFNNTLQAWLMVIAVRIKHVPVGFLVSCAGPDNSFNPDEIQFFQKLNGIFSLELERPSSPAYHEKNELSCLLDEMLETQCRTMPYILSRMEQLQYAIHSHLRVILLYRPEPEQGPFPWHMLSETMRSLFPGSLSTIYEKRLVVCMNQPNPISDYQLGQLRTLARQSGIKIGVSHPFENLGSFYAVYLDTVQMTRIGEHANPKRPCYFYENGIVEMSAYYLIGKIDPHSLAGDAVTKLWRYDIDSGQRSLPTMQAYAECDFNIKQTAQYLHIHENSMRYRIAKMSEICGISFDDIRTQFELILALNLLKFDQPKLE